jgi:hypothetical protein
MNRSGSFLSALLLPALLASAAEWSEDFSTDPTTRGWRVIGDASLSRWNAEAGALDFTWDSAKTNTFFHRPLGTILAETDAFEVEFDAEFSEIQAGGPNGTGGTFEIAFGLYGMDAATRTNFSRGSGVNAVRGPRDIVEFTYFPDTVNGFGDTLSPSIWSRSNQPYLEFIFPYPLHVGVPYRVTMGYQPSGRALTTVLVSNSVPVLTNRVAMTALTTGFRLDAVAVASYQSFGGGSIFARGRFDRIAVRLPDPPKLELVRAVPGPELRFQLPTNWTAAVERTVDFATWETVSEAHAMPPGDGSFRQWLDPSAPSTHAHYRLRLFRP